MYYKHKSVFKDMSALLMVIHVVMDLLQCSRDELRMPACVRACVCMRARVCACECVRACVQSLTMVQ